MAPQHEIRGGAWEGRDPRCVDHMSMCLARHSVLTGLEERKQYLASVPTPGPVREHVTVLGFSLAPLRPRAARTPSRPASHFPDPVDEGPY